jgi:hypothetical protein
MAEAAEGGRCTRLDATISAGDLVREPFRVYLRLAAHSPIQRWNV